MYLFADNKIAIFPTTFHRDNSMKQIFILALVAAAALSACGGGDSASPAVVADGGVSTDKITEASTATATAAGLTVIAAAADEETYDVVADIGDTWRITLNARTGAYNIKVMTTQFGLQSQSGVAVRTVSGNLVTYTANAPEKFVLVIDTRIKSIAGNVTLGGRAATVAGTNYAASDLSKLAGIYSYFGSQRDAVDGSNGEFLAGQLRIAATGATATICDGGTIDTSDNCTRVGTRELSKETVTLTKNPATALIDVKINGTNFGILNVKAGDRGPVLLIDRFGFNNSGAGAVRRVGNIYAVKPIRLTGTELDGNYTCSFSGADLGTVTAAGTSATITGFAPRQVTQEVLSYNQLATTGQILNFDGVVISRVPGESAIAAANLLPLSSTLFVAEGDRSTGLCRRSN